ncbi:galactosyltransferase-related protein [Chitinophaga flava]|uniref:Galactosyltransferase C-terminal domain-containing protein n=1 Tax=Chitinophaga flava TaxID=2259036 RepID=A0A365XV35_9BACT|nr:galactosyltransferase-related protein [Chitinophaga flava]RBL89455.1 hypothetical protein DF182_23355 [Chitinophaga flava]
MTKLDMNDVNFLIFCRIDSNDRINNLVTILSFIRQHFSTNITILETGTTSRISPATITQFAADYEFVEDSQEILHLTRYRNMLLNKAQQKIVFFYDTDIIVPPENISRAAALLRLHPHALVYPFDGRSYLVNKFYSNIYRKINNFQWFEQYPYASTPWFKGTVGGIIGINRQWALDNGFENEQLLGWGPEDKERYYRLKKKGARIIRLPGPLYHLYHERGVNSRPYSEDYSKQNQHIYLNTLMGFNNENILPPY